jgi:hypothetical protein
MAPGVTSTPYLYRAAGMRQPWERVKSLHDMCGRALNAGFDGSIES